MSYQITKIRYSHDACIDMILADPAISQNDLARHFGYSASWISILMNTDAFKERLAQRRAEVTDPILMATIKQRLDVLANAALTKLISRIDGDQPISNKDLIAAAQLGAGSAAARPSTQVTQSLYVVQMPPRAVSSREWLETREITDVPNREIGRPAPER